MRYRYKYKMRLESGVKAGKSKVKCVAFEEHVPAH